MDFLREIKNDLLCPENCKANKLACLFVVFFSAISLAAILYCFISALSSIAFMFGPAPALTLAACILIVEAVFYKKTQ